MPATGAKLLLVDDEPLTLQLLRETLGAADWEVEIASDPRAALERVGAESFAVVISDQKMPHLTGLDFLQAVRRLRPNTTRILLTGVVDVQMVIDGVNRGDLYRFLVKPWLADELLATVRDAVQRHELLGRTETLQAEVAESSRRLNELNHTLEQQLTREQQHNQQLERVNQTLAQQVRSVTSLFEAIMARLPERERQDWLAHAAAVPSLMYDAKGLAVMLDHDAGPAR